MDRLTTQTIVLIDLLSKALNKSNPKSFEVRHILKRLEEYKKILEERNLKDFDKKGKSWIISEDEGKDYE